MIRKQETQEVVSENISSLPDYNVYVMSMKERVMYILLAAAVVYIVSFIFYQNFIISMVVSFIALLYPKIRNREII